MENMVWRSLVYLSRVTFASDNTNLIIWAETFHDMIKDLLSATGLR